MSSSPSAGSAAPAGFDFEQLTPPPAPKRPPRLDEAKTQAQALVVAAEREAERIREEARRAALEEGYAAGRADALKELAPSAEALAAALTAARAREVEV